MVSWGLRQIAPRAAALLCGLTALGATASQAGAYSRVLKVSSAYFIGLQYDGLSVDKHGDMFVLKGVTQGTNELYTPHVEEFNSTGHKLANFTTTFHTQGQTLGLVGTGVAVTPGGGYALVSGQFGQDLSPSNPNVTQLPFIAKYSTSSGKWIRGYNLDTDTNRLAEGDAVDPTGTHVYVLDIPNPFIGGETISRVYEFDVDGLNKVRTFDLSGESDRPDAIAAAPDGHVWVQIEPEGGHTVYDQKYSSSGRYESEFTSPNNAKGLAFDGRGYIFSTTGSGSSVKIERISTSGQLLETFGSSSFDRYPYIETGDKHGNVYAFDDAPSTSILKFAPTIPQTRLTARPPSTLKISTATFKFKGNSSSETFKCRLSVFLERAPQYTTCKSPKVYENLSNQLYSFDVEASSADGFTDTTPAHFQFKVTLAYPQTEITSQPDALIGTHSATFKFKTTSSGATFKCKLRGHRFRACSSPKTYTGLSNGTYTFDVEAISRHGAVDPSPATSRFTVDATPPHVTAPTVAIASPQGPVALTGATSLQVSFIAGDDHTATSALDYTLEHRVGSTTSSFGAWSVVMPTSTADDGQVQDAAVTPSPLYNEFRVVVRNQLGLETKSPPSTPFLFKEFDNTGPAISYSDGWTQGQGSDALHGTVATTTTADATATLQFSGEAVAVIAPMVPAQGLIRACVTDAHVCDTVSLAADTPTGRAVPVVIGGLAPGPHTLTISDLTSQQVALDAVMVLH